MIALVGAVASHVGNVREVNQDRGFVSANTYAVADGMGGHRGGEVAAMLTVSKFESAGTLLSQGDLESIATDANELVFSRSTEDSLQGMGTTLVALAIHDDQAVSIINIGDSRAYWLRDGYLAQVTRDHSFVSDLVDQNEITEEEALNHPKRNIITRALGIAPNIEIDNYPLNVEINDRFLLCSDGLTDEVSESDIVEVLSEYKSPEETAEKLVAMALENGGKDNVTTVIVDVIDATDPDETETKSTPAKAEEDLVHPPSLKKDDAFSNDDTNEMNIEEFQQAGLDEIEQEQSSEKISESKKAAVSIESDSEDKSELNDNIKYLGLALIVALCFLGYFLSKNYASSGFFVGDDDGEVTVFKGKRDGFLWFGPTEAISVRTKTKDLSESSISEMDSSEFETYGEAKLFAESLEVVEIKPEPFQQDLSAFTIENDTDPDTTSTTEDEVDEAP